MTSIPVPLFIEFRWEHKAPTWGPFTREQLIAMVLRVATALRVTPEEAKQIKIVFGDHIVVIIPDQPDHLNSACCLTEYHDDDNSVSQETVILNRSLQVALASAHILDGGPDDEALLHAALETEEELIFWLILEELKHAQISIRAQTRQRIERYKEKYRQYVIGRGIVSSEPYTFDLEEVAVSRATVLRLAEIFAQSAPERSAYFRTLYQLSLSRCTHITPWISGDLARRAYLDESEL